MFETEINELFTKIATRKAKPVAGMFECYIDQTITIGDLVNFLKQKEILFNVCRPFRKEEESVVEETKQEGEGEEEEKEEAPPAEEGEGDEEAKRKAEEEEQKRKEQEAEEAKYTCPADRVTLTDLFLIIEKYFTSGDELREKLKKLPRDELNKENYQYKETSTHYMYMKGVELTLFEFKEIMLELALLIKGREVEEGEKPKIRAMLKKFLEDQVFKGDYSPSNPSQSKPPRVWPISHKEKLIREKREAEEKRAAEEAKQKEEQERQEREIAAMSSEDQRALSPEEVEAAIQEAKEQEAQEASKEEHEVQEVKHEEEDELDDDEPSDSDVPESDY